jgi:hypothetical protein
MAVLLMAVLLMAVLSMTVSGISDGNRHSQADGSEPRPRAESEESEDDSVIDWDGRVRKIYTKYGAIIPHLLAKEIETSEPEAAKVLNRLVGHSGDAFSRGPGSLTIIH